MTSAQISSLENPLGCALLWWFNGVQTLKQPEETLRGRL